VINGDDAIYKVVAFICVVLEIPIITIGQYFVTDAGTVLQWTYPVVISSTLVLVCVLFEFLILYEAWESRGVEGA